MKLAPAAVLFASVLSGCAALRNETPKAPGLLPNAATVAAATALPEPPKLGISLTTDGKLAGQVHAELRVAAELCTKGFYFEPARAKLTTLEAADARGELELSQKPDGAVLRIEAKRAAQGIVTVRYSVALDASVRTPFTSVAEATDLRVEGRDVLLLPVGEEALPVALRITVSAGKSEAASSFAVGSEQRFSARTSELRAATFVAGDLGHAQFRAADGDDFSVWAGFTSFDARWVAAETASVRSAVDDYMGALPHERRAAVSFLLLPEPREQPGASIRLSVRGLVASVDPRSTWSAPLRLRTAQALTQRTIGGRLWIGNRDKAASGFFFSEGFSRAMAQEIVAAIGIFEHADRAAELNTLLQALDLSPLGRASAAELARSADKQEMLRVVTARGALVALSIGAALQKETKGKSSLKTFARALLERADKRDTLPFEELSDTLARLLPKERAENVLRSLSAGGETTVPSDLIGPCYKLVKGNVAPFELGFDVETTPEGLSVKHMIAGSAAAKAGLRDGDVLRELNYQDGRSDLPVITFRVGAATMVTFTPAKKPKPGRYFQRVRGVAERDC